MISATVITGIDNTGQGLEQEFDAQPWFEQANPEQLQRLQIELTSGLDHGNRVVFYEGTHTDNVFGWIAEQPNLRTAEISEILSFCASRDVSWQVVIPHEEVRRWTIMKLHKDIANTAIRKLLGDP